jgi:hypothetical protein
VCQLGSATARVGGLDVNVTAETLCDVDEFVFRGGCLPCPESGTTCINGQIELKQDFWFKPDSPLYGSLTEFWGKREFENISQALGIYRCAPGSCKVDAESGLPACAVGRQGLLCGICQDGYYATDISGCERCPEGANSASEAAGLFVFVVALAAAAWQAKRKIEARHPKLAASMKEKLPEVLKLLTGLFQILGAFATVLYRVPWPGAFRTITSITSMLALDVFSLPSIRCSSLGSTFYDRFNLHMTSMLVITGLFVALLVYAYSRHNQSRARPLKTSLVWNIFLPFLFLIYPSISKTAILMLRCRTIDGASYLLSDIALSCETAEYASHRSFAIFGVLVFPIGIAVFFTALVGHNRRKLPPDWWPACAPAEAQLAYQKYRAKRTEPKKFMVWKAEVWDGRMAKYDKLYKRIGFLFFAYNKGYWWFEPVLLIYKLSMTVLILFVSNGDENKILFGMLGATAMMATLAFFQPFKHPDILSINTGAQMVVLLVLFAAMFLLVNGGSSPVIAVVLVLSTLAPLVAGVAIALRLPAEARAPESGDTLADDLSKAMRAGKAPSLKSLMGSFRGGGRASRAAPKTRGAKKAARAAPAESLLRSDGNPVASAEGEAGEDFGADNPMHDVSESAGRESDLVLPTARRKVTRQLSKLSQDKKQRSERTVI